MVKIILIIILLIPANSWAKELSCPKLYKILFNQCKGNIEIFRDLNHANRDKLGEMYKACSKAYNENINKCEHVKH